MDVYFQVLSLLYVTIITIVFLSKKKISTLQNYVYIGLIVVSYIEIIVDLATRISNYYIIGTALANFLSKLSMSCIMTWSLVFSLYVFVLTSIKIDNDVMTQDKKQCFKKAIIVVLLLLIVLDLIIFVLPIHVEVGYGYQLISGPILYFTYCIIALTLIFNMIMAIRYSKELKETKLLFIHIYNVFVLISFIVLIIYPQISVNVIVVTFAISMIYFTIENPDLQLIEELNIATFQAEVANCAKSTLLSRMFHEISPPLNTIIELSQSIVKEEISVISKDEVKYILNASQTLLEMVNEISDISKIEANEVKIVNVDYSTRELLNEVSTIINTKIGSKPIEFKIEVGEKLPPVLYGDSMRIKQILLNLLTNAVMYTNDGYILFQVNSQTIGSKCKIIIKVEDTGIGMTDEDLEYLYTKFQRFSIDKNVNIVGTGIGMALTKGLIDLLGGEILVKSIYGEGTTFTVFIDQEISDKRVEDVERKEENVDVIPFDASGQKVLVVDDNKINLKVAEKLLLKYNLEIELIDNGYECINRILSGNKYDLILLDIMMPKMKGLEALQNLKNIIGFNTPVVALTADIISGMEDKYINQGFDDCMSKPIVEEELFYMLKRFLKDNNNSKKSVIVSPVTHFHNSKILEDAGVNVKAGLELLKDQELYDETIKEFYNSLEDKMNKLSEYISTEDLENYSILTHALKIEARYLGFNDFADLVNEQELAAKEKRLDYLINNYPKLKMESIRIYDLTKKYFEN